MKQLPLLFIFVFLISIFIFVQRTTPALATTTTLTASADAEIKSSDPSAEFGASSVMDVGRLVPPQTSKKIRALIRFDLSSIPSNATIDSATFSIYLYGCGIYSQTIDDLNIGRNKDSWEESTVNWSNKPSFDGSTVLNKTASCSLDDQYHNYSIKSFVQGWMAGTFPNYGIVLYGDEAPSESWIKFFSPKEDNSRPDPKLVISYTIPTGPGGSDGTSNGDGTGDGSSETNGDETDSIKDGDESATASATISADKTTPSASLAEDQKSKGISGARIILLVTLVIILIAAVAGYIIYRRKKKLKAKKDKESSKPEEKPSSEDQTEGKEEPKPP
jgi:uncharacterized membrane protein